MDAKNAISNELERIEEDCDHSGKSHLNAAERWGTYHFAMGLSSTVLSVVAGTAFLQAAPIAAASVSTVVAVLTALMTFVKPAERAANHKASGDQYLALKNDARILRQTKLPFTDDIESAATAMMDLSKRRTDLNSTSQQFSQRDRLLARTGIEQGESTHRVDRSN